MSKPYWTEKRIYSRLLSKLDIDDFVSIFVAKHNGEVVGTVGVDRYDTTRRTPKYYPCIVNNYVKEEYRNKGIYKKLLNYVFDYMKNLGFEKLYITTDLNEVYEKLGWKYVKNIKLDDGIIEKLYEINI